MKKILNNTFLKQIIDSDFIFAKSIGKNSCKVSSSADITINIVEKKKYHLLDIFQLNTGLKKFMKILQFIRARKRGQEFQIHIWCENEYLFELVEEFVSEMDLSEYVKPTEDIPEALYIPDDYDIKTEDYGTKNRDMISFLFILGNPWKQSISKLIAERMIGTGSRGHIFLINSLNFRVEKQTFGIYKISNDLEDYKKAIFLLVIIYNIIKNK